MKFRQRIAWLLVLLYLAGTCAFIHYLFEINEKFNEFALDHIEQYHNPESKPIEPGKRGEIGIPGLPDQGGNAANNVEEKDSEFAQRPPREFTMSWHLADVPLAVWILLLLVPYLQVFFMLLACTKAEPRISLAFLWPFRLYVWCQGLVDSDSHSGSKSVNSPVPNGYVVVNTWQKPTLLDSYFSSEVHVL